MLVGFLLRRTVTLALCAGSFWLGLKADRMVRPPPAAAPAAAHCPEAEGGG
ncbi:hypothetical protein [Albidovulum sp.]|jgi:hypothetical protein|uniref:hypothetical protein n=1 Tax=Albidovulum sp. TaxID=1872424 RepID=UPI0025C69CD2|nr:hypothetical protein [Defluviimonas sp.]